MSRTGDYRHICGIGKARHGGQRPDGKARFPVQAPGLRLPVVRDLRRHGLRVGLRPAGRGAQAQRQGRVVARDGARARRHRGARRRHPDAPAGVGGQRATSPSSPIRWWSAATATAASAWTRCSTRRARQTWRTRSAPAADKRGEWTEPRNFNLMFKTFMGPVEDTRARGVPATGDGAGHLRELPERAAERRGSGCPFGIAQIGKAFRNEITPGNFIFRTREFEQMEMQFFVEPGTDEEWFEHWSEERMDWHTRRVGLAPDRLRYQHRTKSWRTTPTPRATSSSSSAAPSATAVGRDRGHPQPHRLRPDAAPGVLSGKKLEYVDRGQREEATSRTSSRRRWAPTG